MAISIKIPSVGESVSEVTIGKWLKQDGDEVGKDEIVLSLETDKVNVEVTSPVAGVLRNLKRKEGDTAKIDEVVAEVEEGASGKKAAPAKKGGGAKEEKSAPVAETKPAAAALAPKSDAKDKAPQASGFAMPAAERAMATGNVDASQVSGNGPQGRILKEDVERTAQGRSGAASAPQTPSGGAADGNLTEVVPMSALRKKIAERLKGVQQTAAILTTFNEVDMSAAMALRKRHQDAFVQKNGIKLGFMSFFVKAAIEALRAYPEINASIEGNNIVYRRYYDVGVAVGTEKGLVVPVIKRAELLSFAEIEQSIADFGKRAKAGKLTLEEMSGGTFTITNGGVFGSMMSTPILNPPQSGILGMHSILERPVAEAGQVVIKPMMYLALSYDHRVVDGRGAVLFLKRIKECVESPERMLLEI